MDLGNLQAIIIAQLNSISVQLKHSATLFWEGEYGAVVSMIIHFSSHQVRNSLDKYSPPLSKQILFEI